MGDFSIQRFEESGRENGARYWYAHEFMRNLGYDSWPTFQKVITRAMGSCAKLGIDPTEAFARAAFIEDGKEIVSYKLSRFACFLVSMHADSKKEEVSKAKTILATIADNLIEERIHEHDLGRIETRDDLKLAERVLSGAAQSAGLESHQFGIFKDAGFRGMYNMSLSNLMLRKGVEKKKVLYDYMGLEELAGNLFRVTQTAARINNQGVRGLPALSDTATRVGREVRTIMIRNGGKTPESLPVAEDISGVKRRLKSANRAMKKMERKEEASQATTHLRPSSPSQTAFFQNHLFFGQNSN
jgi:DNA-damage-inducible protein D